jgi:hypothetical protein
MRCAGFPRILSFTGASDYRQEDKPALGLRSGPFKLQIEEAQPLLLWFLQPMAPRVFLAAQRWSGMSWKVPTHTG